MKSKVIFFTGSALSTARGFAVVQLFAIIITLTLSMPPVAVAQHEGEPPVYLVGSGNLVLDSHIRKLLEKELQKQSELVVISADQAELAIDGPIITLGPAAFSHVRQANRKASVLALLVEPDFLQGFANRSPGQISGIYYGVSLLRQALIGKAILPQATRIALLSTTDTAELYELLIDQLSAYDMEARLFVVDDQQQLIPTLNRALRYGDFLLAAPDTSIYNPRTIKHILLTAYRRNRIVVGPSQAYVKAGAIASGYTPFPAIAEMAADYLHTFHTTGAFPAPDYSTEFGVEINEQVARSLNIPLATREQLIESVTLRIKHDGEPDSE